MIDHEAMIADPAGEAPPENHDHAAETLEQRVHRLEDAVAALQDMQLVEERITERVIDRMQHKPAPASTGIIDAGRHPPAAAADPPRTEAPRNPTPAPAAAPRRAWLLVEVFREMRTLVGMFFDSRYRVSWSAFFALMVLAYILVSHYLWKLWLAVPVLGLLSIPMDFPFIGPLLDKAVDLVLALFAYKTLSREMARYKEAIGRPSRRRRS